jgi:putative ABC transport system permease protein
MLAQDVRLAFRLLIKDSLFTAATLTVLALAIGMITTIFTYVNAQVLRDLPVPSPGRLISFGVRDNRGRDLATVSYADVTDWGRAAKSFSTVAAFSSTYGRLTVSGDGHAAERYYGTYMSAAGFGAVGVQPRFGRYFRPEDDTPGATAVAVIGYNVWRSRYGGDPRVIGQRIKVNEQPAEIVGVMPEDMRFPIVCELWIPLSHMVGVIDQPRDARTLSAFGRLADGVSLTAARSELESIGERLARDYPATNASIVPTVVTFHDRYTSPELKRIASLLLAAAGVLLLMSCFNAASLALARAARRAKEMALRVSLGATRWLLSRQLLVESTVPALLAGVAGFALSVAGARLLQSTFAGVPNAYWVEYTMDRHVYAFLVGVCFAVVAGLGVAPALCVADGNLNDLLKEGGHAGVGSVRVRRWNSALVVTDVALTFALLAGGGLFVQSSMRFTHMSAGLDSPQVLTIQLSLPPLKYAAPDRRIAFDRELEDRLARIPNVGGVALVSHLPIYGGFRRQLLTETVATESVARAPTVTMVSVTPGYFAALGISLIRGRGFSGDDGRPGHESAIVSQRFAAMYFGEADAIGRRIRLADGEYGKPSEWLSIVGVSPTIRQRNVLEPDPDPVVYLPYRVEPAASCTLLIKSSMDPVRLTPALRESVRELDADLPLFDVQTLEARLAQVRWNWEIFAKMFGIFAAVAVAISAVGLYAVTAQAVTDQIRELGIRIALGAQRRQIWLFVGRGVAIRFALGLAAGFVAAVGVGRLMENLLVQTSAVDAQTLALVCALLVAVAAFACVRPIRRATLVDPTVALRA